ncbi:hypothetical protein KSP40_PGU006280 [Platanthera guangdongensis]|uniref:Uncharacterized protein n=1 Tax=Platanthera guangdongensis TaxID=2320717 RepID=A0ABR2MCN2_9ASPA
MASSSSPTNFVGLSGVRIMVVGDVGIGKSSLIVAAATESFPENVPSVLPPPAPLWITIQINEETKSADINGPRGIISAIGISIIVGWGYLLGITFTVTNIPYLLSVDNDAGGYAVAEGITFSDKHNFFWATIPRRRKKTKVFKKICRSFHQVDLKIKVDLTCNFFKEIKPIIKNIADLEKNLFSQIIHQDLINTKPRRRLEDLNRCSKNN